MRVGVDYYPEQWPKERWKTDACLMEQAGIKVIRVAEFSWSLLEPSEGNFRFGWLDDALSVFSQRGIRVVLSTPTAAPPKWLVDKYPDILQRDRNGLVRQFGGRRHYCPNSQDYLARTERIVEELASHFGRNPAVEAWQIDNEFGNENSVYCYCDQCERRFRRWLERKYRTIEQLNHTYGTVFWSQHYNSFEEVILPKASQCEESCPETRGLNPSLLLDYKRFASDSMVRYQQLQIDILRRYSDAPVTTNLMGTFSDIDYFDLAKNLDFVSWDNYPDTQWGVAKPAEVSFSHALMRSLKKEAPLWVMEQQSGPCGWSQMGGNPEPGKLRLWTYQSIANGVETALYFRWRAALFGTEQYWHGILNHDGEKTRRYQEIGQTAAELEKLDQDLGSLRFFGEAAIVKSYETLWSHGIHSHASGFSYSRMLQNIYSLLFERGVDTDFAAPKEDIGGYPVVFAPALNLVDEKTVGWLERYVENGGYLILTYRSGTRDLFNTMYPLPAPGLLEHLTGVRAADFDPLGERTVPISSIFGTGTATVWGDILELSGAQTLAVYGGNYYAGSPCITEYVFGQGKVYYVGCGADSRTMGFLLDYILRKNAKDKEWDILPEGVEVHKAVSKQGRIRFILNHNETAALIKLPDNGYEWITGRRVQPVLRLEPFGVAIWGEVPEGKREVNFYEK